MMFVSLSQSLSQNKSIQGSPLDWIEEGKYVLFDGKRIHVPATENQE